jgi:hypothetical protein
MRSHMSTPAVFCSNHRGPKARIQEIPEFSFEHIKRAKDCALDALKKLPERQAVS